MHKRLQKERQNLGLTQDQLAEIGGVKRRAQINYESGERCPDGHYFAAIAAAGADVQYILTGIRSGSIDSSQPLTPREKALLENFRKAPGEDDKQAIEKVAEMAAKTRKGRENKVLRGGGVKTKAFNWRERNANSRRSGGLMSKGQVCDNARFEQWERWTDVHRLGEDNF